MTSQQIGRYRIERRLGEGRISRVYLAQDPEIDRPVAVKVLRNRLALDSHSRTQFIREARVVASLEHPCIIPVYDIGEYEGQLFIVMPFMANGSLADRMSKNPLSELDAVKIFQDIIPALSEAHHNGIVHRDLKPSNILFDRHNRAFLSDFDLAKLLDETSSSTSGIVGTPHYISPEQVFDHPVDARSDIYSLGIILYEMLTGRVPFDADTTIALIMKQSLEAPIAPRQVNPSLSEWVEQVILRAIAKIPDERYQSADEMLTELERVSDTQPHSSRQYQESNHLQTEIEKALPALDRGEITREEVVELEQLYSLAKWILKGDVTGWYELYEQVQFGDGLRGKVRSLIERELEHIQEADMEDDVKLRRLQLLIS